MFIAVKDFKGKILLWEKYDGKLLARLLAWEFKRIIFT